MSGWVPVLLYIAAISAFITGAALLDGVAAAVIVAGCGLFLAAVVTAVAWAD